MDVTTSATLTAIVATIGRYTKYKKWPNIKFVVGSGMYLLFMTAIDKVEPRLAKQLGTLVLVSVLLAYIASIAKATHVDSAAKGVGLAK